LNHCGLCDLWKEVVVFRQRRKRDWNFIFQTLEFVKEVVVFRVNFLSITTFRDSFL
jgi:hypothetical protein